MELIGDIRRSNCCQTVAFVEDHIKSTLCSENDFLADRFDRHPLAFFSRGGVRHPLSGIDLQENKPQQDNHKAKQSQGKTRRSQ
jgi:hypothetical protein